MIYSPVNKSLESERMSSNLNRLVQPECGAPNPLVAAAQQIATINKSGSSIPITSLSRLRSQQAEHSSVSIHRQPMNFTKEFAQHAPIALPQMLQTIPAQVDGNREKNTQSFQQQNYPVGQQPLHPMQYFNSFLKAQPQQQQQRPDAGDQLVTKYRNDMIAQSNMTTTKMTENHADGDVEFWQSLAQTYMGPSTFNNIARLRAERAAREELATKDGQQQQQTRTEEELDNSGQQQQQNEASDWAETEQLLKEMHLASESKDKLDYTFDERNPLKDQFENPFAEGLKRLELGDIPSAALLFEAAVQLESNNALAWQYLGTTQAQNEKDRSAISALKNCLEHDPDNQQARLAIAASLVNETKYQDACNYLIEWLVKHEKYGREVNASLEEYRQLDNTLNREDSEFLSGLPERHYEYVRDKFVQAARISPTNPDPEVQNSLGVIFNMRGEYDKAVDCFKAALSVRSEDSLLWNRLGATLANGNKSDEAVVAYRRALEIAPGFLRSRYNLAISLIHLNLYDEAARQLIQILNMQAAGNKGASSGAASMASGSQSVASGSTSAQSNVPGGVIRARSITSTSIWNTLRTVATLMNKPGLYPHIDGRDLDKCNEAVFGPRSG